MKIRNIGLLLLLSIALVIPGCGTTNIRLEKNKLQAIKKIALLQTLFEIPTISGDRSNFFIRTRGEAFDKGFAAIKTDLTTAELQSAAEIREAIAKRMASDFSVPVLSGTKFIQSKEFQTLEKKGVPSIALESNSREGMSIILAAGEKNFLKPTEANIWNGRESSITGMLAEGDLTKLIISICEHLQVDAIAFATNSIDPYLASNKSGAVLRNSIFIFDKSGARVLTAHTYSDQDLNGGDDINGFRLLLSKSVENIDKLFIDLAGERK